MEDTVARIEAEKLLKKIEEHLKDVPELPPGTVVKWIRCDRESHWFIGFNKVFIKRERLGKDILLERMHVRSSYERGC